MADYTEEISLADTKVGDRWIGISSITPTINEQTPGNALTRVRMVFRLGASLFTLDSESGGDGDISIDDEDTWECSIAAMDTFLPRAGKWEFDMEFYQTGYDSPWTLYRGTLTVHDDV